MKTVDGGTLHIFRINFDDASYLYKRSRHENIFHGIKIIEWTHYLY